MDLRRRIFAAGLRYKVDAQVLPGLRRRADLVFTRAQIAVFVDGCFWHGCETHARATKSNTLWWREKIDHNKARDLDTTAALEAAGWTVLRVWEHEPPEDAAIRIVSAVEAVREEQAAS